MKWNMHAAYVLLILIGALSTLLHGCGKEKTAEDTGSLIAFEYRYGSGFSIEPIYEYTLETRQDEAGNEEVVFRKTNCNIEETVCESVVERSVMDELSDLIFENGISAWDGFSKEEKGLCDGFSFTLTVSFEQETISANGYGLYPKGYREGHKALVHYLEGIAENILNDNA